MDNEQARAMLDEVYKTISAIPVKGDNVDIMAAARCQLRALYALLGESEKGDEQK